MAKDVKSLDEGLQLLIRRNKKTNTKSVDDIRKALKEKTSIDLSTVTWNKGSGLIQHGLSHLWQMSYPIGISPLKS